MLGAPDVTRDGFRRMSSGMTGFCNPSSPPPRLITPCCARPFTSLSYSSLNRRASVCLARSILFDRLAMFLPAASRVCCRRFTLSASMHTLSMLCASSKTTTHSFSSSRLTSELTLGSSKY